MAIYHFHARLIRRSAGQSVVAAAAWQNACRLRDERLGQVSDFTGHRRVVYSTLLHPARAAPGLEDRERFWNAVEAVEIRRDAQLARQFDLAMPDEFDTSSSIGVLRRFATEVLCEAGLSADLALIETEASAGKRRHGYVLAPTRPLDETGFGPKLREWNVRKKLVEIRQIWAAIINDRLTALRHDVRVDHRSNEERGIDAAPVAHIGSIRKRIAARKGRPFSA